MDGAGPQPLCASAAPPLQPLCACAARPLQPPLPPPLQLKPVFKYFETRTPDTLTEVQEHTMTWHFQEADEDFAEIQARYRRDIGEM